MTKSPARNVIGVDFHAKQLAEEAARLSDMPVSEWLANIIAEKASELGVDSNDDEEDETSLEAITANLAKSWKRPQIANRPGANSMVERAVERESDEEAQDDDPEHMARAEPPRRRIDPLEASFDDLRRKRARAPLTRALQSHAAPRQDADVQAKLTSVTRRLATIENALTLLLEDMEERNASPASGNPLRAQFAPLVKSRR